MNDIKSYLCSVRLYLKSVLVFRGSLFLFFIGLFALYFTSFTGIWLLLNRFEKIGDWTFGQIVFIFILSLMSYGIRNLFFFQFRLLGQMVKTGELDRHLVRPFNPILSIMGSRLEISGMVHVILGIVLLIMFHKEIGIEWSISNSFWFLTSLLAGALVQGAITIIIGALSFYITDTSGLDQLYNGLREFIWYPINMYDRVIQAVLVFIMPLAFVSFIPAGIFLDNPFYLKWDQSIWKAALMINVFIFVIAIKFFCYGINKYTSTGS